MTLSDANFSGLSDSFKQDIYFVITQLNYVIKLREPFFRFAELLT